MNKIKDYGFRGNWLENINSENVVYCITNLANNKKYIGIAKKLKQRITNYISDIKSKNNRAIICAINKYSPENFSFDIIEKNNSYEICLSREIELIANYKANGFILYNRTFGGEGFTRSSDTFPLKTKLNKEDFERIFFLYHNDKKSPSEIGKLFGVSYNVVFSLLKGKTFKIIAKDIRDKFPKTRKPNELSYTDNTSGFNNYQCKFKYEDFENIFNLYYNHSKSLYRIAKIYNSTRLSIRNILNGVSYKHITINLFKKFKMKEPHI